MSTIRFVWILGRLSMSGRFNVLAPGPFAGGHNFSETFFIRLLRSYYRSPIMQFDVRDPIEDEPVLVWRNPLDGRLAIFEPLFRVRFAKPIEKWESSSCKVRPAKCNRLDECPYTFLQKRLSAIVREDSENTLIIRRPLSIPPSLQKSMGTVAIGRVELPWRHYRGASSQRILGPLNSGRSTASFRHLKWSRGIPTNRNR